MFIKLITGPCPEPLEFNHCAHTLLHVVHFNIILTRNSGSSKCLLFRCLGWNAVHMSRFITVLLFPSISHLWIAVPVNIWRVETSKLLIPLFSTSFSLSVSLSVSIYLSLSLLGLNILLSISFSNTSCLRCFSVRSEKPRCTLIWRKKLFFALYLWF
jgi:hypothetical protein